MGISKKKLSTLLIASLMSISFVCAETYKNNVVDVRVNNENGNAVKVTIYTDKPYTDPVVVNKKANNKYVILMPETNSVLKTAPKVTNGAGTISNVSVNTQSVSGGKGYTKITITSEKAINVVPRTQQVTTKVKIPPTTQVTKLSSTEPIKTSASKPTAKTQPTTQKVTQQKPKQKPVKKVVAEKPKQEQVKKPVQQKQVQPAVKPVKVAQEPKKEPIEILEQEIKTGQYANLTQDNNDAVLNKEINENIKNEKKRTPVVDVAKDKSVIESIKAVIKDYQNISIWKLLLLAGAITFPIIVIMVILGLDKKINKQIEKTFKKEEEYVSEEQDTNNYTEETPSELKTESTTYSSFNEMLDDVTEPELSFHEEQINRAELNNFVQKTPEEFFNDYSDEDFVPEQPQEVIPEPVIESEATETGFDNIVNEVQEEPAEETFIPPVENVEQPTEPYEPDGYLSDFAEVEDSDFFDELAMQTMAENNSEGLPTPSPADEVFNFMSDDEPPAEPTVEQPTEQTEQPLEAVKEETVSEPEITEPYSDDELEEPECEVYSQGDDELTMLTEVKLNDTTGLYLVNYDNFSSLVGHIDDDYFVIKKFDEIVTGKIFLKETEKLKDSKRYLVRVGKNKMVVEVSDNSMSKLLDL